VETFQNYAIPNLAQINNDLCASIHALQLTLANTTGLYQIASYQHCARGSSASQYI